MAQTGQFSLQSAVAVRDSSDTDDLVTATLAGADGILKVQYERSSDAHSTDMSSVLMSSHIVLSA